MDRCLMDGWVELKEALVSPQEVSVSSQIFCWWCSISAVQHEASLIPDWFADRIDPLGFSQKVILRMWYCLSPWANGWLLDRLQDVPRDSAACRLGMSSQGVGCILLVTWEKQHKIRNILPDNGAEIISEKNNKFYHQINDHPHGANDGENCGSTAGQYRAISLKRPRP